MCRGKRFEVAQTHTDTQRHTHTHTHKNTQPFYGPLGFCQLGTTQVSRHQKDKTRKVKPIWIYWSTRVAVASAGPYANLHLYPDTQPRQHPTPPAFFIGQIPFLLPKQQRQSAEGMCTDMKNVTKTGICK